MRENAAAHGADGKEELRHRISAGSFYPRPQPPNELAQSADMP